jgi:hypothetical protein
MNSGYDEAAWCYRRRRYASYLATERGLALATVALNVRLVRPFLLRRAQERDGRLDLDQLTAAT